MVVLLYVFTFRPIVTSSNNLSFGWTIWEIIQGSSYYVADLLTNPVKYSVGRERAFQ
jgi:hypothetical protein